MEVVVHLEVAAGAVVGLEGAVVGAVVVDAAAASSAAPMTTGPVSAPIPAAVMVVAAAAAVSEAVAEVSFIHLCCTGLPENSVFCFENQDKKTSIVNWLKDTAVVFDGQMLIGFCSK